jgi:hypothetical protein
MSDDPQQEYFSDGMTEDLITNLSKISGLFVIARNSTFVYKGKSVNVQQVSRELGVKYVLEGSEGCNPSLAPAGEGRQNVPLAIQRPTSRGFFC